MHPRYSGNQVIESVWSELNKLGRWQKVELAVLDARAFHAEIPSVDAEQIRHILESTAINLEWWTKEDTRIGHDLLAFIAERKRHLPEKLRRFLHEKMTSYDTEEPAFAIMLRESVEEVVKMVKKLCEVLVHMTERYRFTVMLGETHGQWAELQTFGKRVATWLAQLILGLQRLVHARINLKFSKLSGAVGNSIDLSEEIQKRALLTLGLAPFHGATQIMPRENYLPIAEGLGQIMGTLAKIAHDIRLNARSVRPLMREPFGKTQKGSSRMPHKRNTIGLEQVGGLNNMAMGYVTTIRQTIQTWQERGIEQSCVERIAWPDLFFVTTHALKQMTRILSGLEVYPDEMLAEIMDSGGTFAASRARDFLAEHGAQFGIDEDSAYLIVQLAAFNVFEPNKRCKDLRNRRLISYDQAEEYYRDPEPAEDGPPDSIRNIIRETYLCPTDELAADDRQVRAWNTCLEALFGTEGMWERWQEVFRFEHNLRGDAAQIDGVLADAKPYLGES